MSHETVRPVRLLLCGFGRVGRAFARLVHERAPDLRRAYGLDLRLVGVADLGGSVAADGALPVPDLIAYFEGGRNLGEFPGLGRPGWSGREAMEGIVADVFVETTPTNYILTRMHQAGASYAEALAGAQRLGIAETNPALDVEGRDTANKVLVIANEVMEAGLAPEAVAVTGITGVTPADIRAARSAGRVLKLVGRATAEPSGVRALVAPEALAADHPLAHVHGSEKAITFLADTIMDRVTVSGGKSDPRGAAAALLKDILNIYCGA